jgi:hypothetical protein
LKRLPNLVLVVAPYAVGVPLALTVSQHLSPSMAAGLVAVALAPGALLGPAFVAAAGGRRADMAGALLLGTVILSVVLVGTRPDGSALALAGAQAFLIGSFVAGAMPTVRDRIAAPLRWAGHLAALVVAVLAAASRPAFDASMVILALVAVALTIGIAGTVALALRRDLLSALAVAGTRDPIVAIAFAWSIGGRDATALPIANAVILGGVAAAVILRRR